MKQIFVFIDDCLLKSVLGRLLRLRPVFFTRSMAQANFVATTDARPEQTYSSYAAPDRIFNHLSHSRIFTYYNIFTTLFNKVQLKAFEHFPVIYDLSKQYDEFMAHFRYLAEVNVAKDVNKFYLPDLKKKSIDSRKLFLLQEQENDKLWHKKLGQYGQQVGQCKTLSEKMELQQIKLTRLMKKRAEHSNSERVFHSKSVWSKTPTTQLIIKEQTKAILNQAAEEAEQKKVEINEMYKFTPSSLCSKNLWQEYSRQFFHKMQLPKERIGYVQKVNEYILQYQDQRITLNCYVLMMHNGDVYLYNINEYSVSVPLEKLEFDRQLQSDLLSDLSEADDQTHLTHQQFMTEFIKYSKTPLLWERTRQAILHQLKLFIQLFKGQLVKPKCPGSFELFCFSFEVLNKQQLQPSFVKLQTPVFTALNAFQEVFYSFLLDDLLALTLDPTFGFRDETVCRSDFDTVVQEMKKTPVGKRQVKTRFAGGRSENGFQLILKGWK